MTTVHDQKGALIDYWTSKTQPMKHTQAKKCKLSHHLLKLKQFSQAMTK